MHEFSICRGLLSQVETIAREHNARRVSAVLLRIGPLAGVDPALLHHAFDALSADGPTRDARLEIETLPVRVRCGACRHEAAAACNSLACSACGNRRTELIQGNELQLVHVELELELDKNHV